MQTKISITGGFLRSSFFSTLIYCNFFFSACFLIVLTAEGVQVSAAKKIETVQQKPSQQSVSAIPVTLISMQ